MSKCILITGGSRSGKSMFAQKLAESFPAPRAYIATAPVTDDEMRQRIREHQLSRSKRAWTTIEAPLDLGGAIQEANDYPIVLVDCLTLWVNNLMFAAEQHSKTISEATIARRCKEVLKAAKEHPGTVIFVTNEVGMSIVPENKLARQFRDLAGRANQVIAAACEEVILVVCGQALKIKPPLINQPTTN